MNFSYALCWWRSKNIYQQWSWRQSYQMLTTIYLIVGKIYLLGNKLQKILFITTTFPIWCDYRTDIFTQSFHCFYALREHWFDCCFLIWILPHIIFPMSHIPSYNLFYCLPILIQFLLFAIKLTLHMESSFPGTLLTWHIVCDSSDRKILIVSLT